MAFQGVFENKFAPAYMRNHKAVTVKNLRCFPRCGPEHKDNGFCGNEVIVRWTTNGRSRSGEYQAFSEFNEAESHPRYSQNELVQERDVHEVATLMRGEVQDVDPNNGMMHFTRETKGWHYGWMAGRGNGSQALHEMRVFLFEKVDPTHLICRLVLRSPPFQVTSRKRIRPKKGHASGEDGKRKRSKKSEGDDEEDDDDDLERPKAKATKKTPIKKELPKPSVPQPSVVKPSSQPTSGNVSLPPPPPHHQRSETAKRPPPPPFFPNTAPRAPPVFMSDRSGDSTSSGQQHGGQQHGGQHVGQHGGQQHGQYALPPRPNSLPSQQQQQSQHSFPFGYPPTFGQRTQHQHQHQSSGQSNPQQAAPSQPSSTMSFPPPPSRTPQMSWPYGTVSSTPPLYLPSLTPPIYNHGISTTPPIFLPMFGGGGEQPVLPSLSFPPNPDGSTPGGTEEVLGVLWNPTPPSFYPNLLGKMQSQPLYHQHHQQPLHHQPRDDGKEKLTG